LQKSNDLVPSWQIRQSEIEKYVYHKYPCSNIAELSSEFDVAISKQSAVISSTPPAACVPSEVAAAPNHRRMISKFQTGMPECWMPHSQIWLESN